LEIISKNVSPEIKKNLLKYVLITGGNSKTNGFSERIKRELRMLTDYKDKINIVHRYTSKYLN
jgi:actin-related protein